MTDQPYTLSAIRAVTLAAQQLITPNGGEAPPQPDAIQKTAHNLGWVQIDTLQMVARSHYVTLWSRIGSYDPADFEGLVYDENGRQFYEYWGHAASIIPLAEYRYSLPTMRRARENPNKWWSRWLTETTNSETLQHVRERLHADGPVRSADFENPVGESGQWWDWKPAKRALEYLFAIGEVMVRRRVNFQRVYDLTERVLPGWVDTTEPTAEDADRYVVERAVKAVGVCRPEQAAEYAYMGRGKAKPIVKKLIDEGRIVTIRGTLLNGEAADLIIHPDNVPLLEQAAAGDLRPMRTTFLNPFDSLFWAKGRDEDFWGFQQRLEAYKPAKDRIWGYYTLPILHHDRLVGRFDPKLERKTGVLRLKTLYLHEGVTLDDELIAGVAEAMRDFLAVHNASEVVIEKSSPPEFGKGLLKAL